MKRCRTRLSSVPAGIFVRIAAGLCCLAGAIVIAPAAVSGAGQIKQSETPPGKISFVGSNRLVTANGSFRRWKLTKSEITRGDDGKVSGVDLHVQVEIASIDTGNSQRDSHLRSGDFFDVARYPTAELRLYDARPKGEAKAGVQPFTGKMDFSMHGTKRTYNVAFDVVDGKQVEVRGKLTINRTSFGVGGSYRRLNPLSVYDPVSINYSANIAK